MATRADKSVGRRPRVVDVRGARKKAGLSQAKLASIAEISRFRLHQHEAGITQLTELELRRVNLVLQHVSRTARETALAREQEIAQRLEDEKTARNGEAAL